MNVAPFFEVSVASEKKHALTLRFEAVKIEEKYETRSDRNKCSVDVYYFVTYL